MNRYKEFNNLYQVYKKMLRKSLIAFFVLIVLCVMFFMLIVFDMPIEFSLGVVTCFFGAIAAGIMCLVLGPLTAKRLSKLDPIALSRVNEALPTLKMQEGFGVTADAIVIVRSMALYLYPVKNALWIHKNVTTTVLYGIIPIYKSSSLIIGGKDKKSFQIGIKNKSEIVDYLHSELQKYRKGIFYGYSDELSRLYNNDIDRMIAMSVEYNSQYNEMTFDNNQV